MFIRYFRSLQTGSDAAQTRRRTVGAIIVFVPALGLKLGLLAAPKPCIALLTYFALGVCATSFWWNVYGKDMRKEHVLCEDFPEEAKTVFETCFFAETRKPYSPAEESFLLAKVSPILIGVVATSSTFAFGFGVGGIARKFVSAMSRRVRRRKQFHTSHQSH